MEDTNSKKNTDLSNSKLQPQFVPEGLDQNLILKEQDKLFKTLRKEKLHLLFEKYKEKCQFNETNDDDNEKLELMTQYLKNNNYNDDEFIDDFYELRKAFIYEKQKLMREKILDSLKDTIGTEEIMASTFYNKDKEPYHITMAKIEEKIKMREKVKENACRKKLCEEIKINYKKNFQHKNSSQCLILDKTFDELKVIHENISENIKEKLQKDHDDKLLYLKNNNIDEYEKYKETVKQSQLEKVYSLFDTNSNNPSDLTISTDKIHLLLSKTTNEVDINVVKTLVECYENQNNVCLYNKMPATQVKIVIGFIQSLYNIVKIRSPVLILVSDENHQNIVKLFNAYADCIEIIEYAYSMENIKFSKNLQDSRKERCVILKVPSLPKDSGLIANIKWASVICFCDKIEDVERINRDINFTTHKILFIDASFDTTLTNMWTMCKLMHKDLFSAPDNIQTYLDAPIISLNDTFDLSHDEELEIICRMKKYLDNSKRSFWSNAQVVNIFSIPLTKTQDSLCNICKNINTQAAIHENKRPKPLENTICKIALDVCKALDLSTILQKVSLHPFLIEPLQKYFETISQNSIYLVSSKFIALYKFTEIAIKKDKKIIIAFTDNDLMNLYGKLLTSKNIKWLITEDYDFCNQESQNNNTLVFIYFYNKLSNFIALDMHNSFDVLLIGDFELIYEAANNIKNARSICFLLAKNTYEEEFLYKYSKDDGINCHVIPYPFQCNTDLYNPGIVFPEIEQTLFEEEYFEVQKVLDVNQTDAELKNKLLDVVCNATRDGHECINMFFELPDKTDYPDYYEFIKSPISVNEIKTKCQTESYTVSDLISDFILMFDNALRYNVEESEVYKDALFLKKQVQSYRAKIAKDQANADRYNK